MGNLWWLVAARKVHANAKSVPVSYRLTKRASASAICIDVVLASAHVDWVAFSACVQLPKHTKGGTRLLHQIVQTSLCSLKRAGAAYEVYDGLTHTAAQVEAIFRAQHAHSQAACMRAVRCLCSGKDSLVVVVGRQNWLAACLSLITLRCVAVLHFALCAFEQVADFERAKTVANTCATRRANELTLRSPCNRLQCFTGAHALTTMCSTLANEKKAFVSDLVWPFSRPET